jgi:hypothetical protein
VNSLQRWFRRRAPRLERFLFICTAVLLALLLVSQLLMLNAKVRRFLSSVDSLEGLPYRGPAE